MVTEKEVLDTLTRVQILSWGAICQLENGSDIQITESLVKFTWF